MIANAITIISKPISSKNICNNAPSLNTSPKADFESFINSISCGIINGKPRIAITAAFCWALAAIAAIKVNTRLRLIPPIKAMPAKRRSCITGFPNKILKSNKLTKIMMHITSVLYMSFAIIKITGLVIEKK